MAAHTSRGTSFGSVLLGALLATAIFAAISIWATGRQEPMRTVELDIPAPSLDLPPGSIPEVQEAAPAQ